MTPQLFKETWPNAKDELSPISPSRLVELHLNPLSTNFLITAGLPEEASPYLTFATDTDEPSGAIQLLTSMYDFLEPVYDKYVVIGTDGSGDVIAINTSRNDRIEWLDHEDDFAARFMNTSIETLADFLFFYQTFVNTVIADNGEDAYIDGNFSDAHFDALRQKMIKTDRSALNENCFWRVELDCLLSNREDFLDNG